MSFGDRLIKTRKEHGYTREALAQELGISKFTLRNYELNATEPGHTFLKLISDFFNVSVDYLMELTDEKEVLHTFRLRSSEQNMIEQYRTLDPHGRDMVDTVLQKEVERMESLEKEPAPDPTAHIYPYLGKIACAGTGFYFDDIPTDTIEAPYVEGADFIIGVSGESMEPDYHDGEKLYVRKVEYLRNGDVGIFTIGNECFLKELGEDGLISRNKNYDDIPGDEKVRLIGKVIGKVEV
ncbi:LexA family transcriptional regulator [Schaedlerella arabinosiphila]|uniref:LexA family transcriptional regulator n=1 Tax=Schaedlerella arabinosiphila TaxID=2044587 RepID=A0A426DEN5_9FIRM|nr:XRE family transcriptional regulator [Schaedlerella arabinosiphila]RRK31182.1 LexA family transcriptional regulator [Schaedlerella arabinosiphila]